MSHHPCPHCRAIVASMAAMNMRAVISSNEISYFAVARRAIVHPATHQPRNEKGQFARFCALGDHTYLSADGTADEFKVSYWLDAIEDSIHFEDESIANDLRGDAIRRLVGSAGVSVDDDLDWDALMDGDETAWGAAIDKAVEWGLDYYGFGPCLARENDEDESLDGPDQDEQ